ncbi:MAG: hypothetical protein E7643_09475 [Ruminococcaceae bacterium]|nr:hypothetical protein [Oscillospiraceae bacterium]
MKQIKITDATLCKEGSHFSFKEKIEIARQLERLNVDVIALPEISNTKTDTLLIRTISTFVRKSVISVAAGVSTESVENAIAAVSNAVSPRIRITLPVSPVGMEYVCHKKPDKMLAWIEKTVAMAKEKCTDVEFFADDATRAEREFLYKAIDTAIAAGASEVTVCDKAAEMLPDDFAAFVTDVCAHSSVPVNVSCSNGNGMACACAILAVRSGASGVTAAVGDESVSLETFAGLIKNCGVSYDFSSELKYTEVRRIIKQILWVVSNAKNEKGLPGIKDAGEESIFLDGNDDREAVSEAILKLGYDLSEEDKTRVFEEFLRVAGKKRVGAKDLEAIIASVALQVPTTYSLISYVINNGNIISSSAQITLEKNGEQSIGVCIGDGPVDAAFRAIEQIIGHHYELDDFQIQSVTEGKEAMGSALVKLRSEGRLYSGNGISTDIIGAAIRAYINAVNKIVYEEAAI